ncbi:MAG: nucleotide exchange factor GrpE [Candidatus Pacebacteria bacterium]|jgi:molecular chaperone GrpE|nr:nucleotide exchange factor GrpE [Candidatus Paceibacterota bacterium]NMB47718.1 nucleotide exchange factor GrpE [Patescibacteria group bacterium]MDD2796579.1 nucleotide exchange factor GrpE [Candidatus Paceibacterota bacterium]MDD3048103.1 nucleotide exchange factor GrpE [Candidatus Paceibacterota bacterium]MDD3509757.1 nucleotide exchange factor GrpE [Candidatus Paceibacterota bacterium]
MKKQGGKKIKELEKEIETLIQEKDEYLNSWKRDLANYINYKNKECERTQEVVISLKELMFQKIIQILDNMYIAEKSIEKKLIDNPSIKGLLMIRKQMEDFLKSEGVSEIDEKKFNPEVHEIVEEVETSQKSGEVIEIIQKGYKINGKVLRPAKVKINKLS